MCTNTLELLDDSEVTFPDLCLKTAVKREVQNGQPLATETLNGITSNSRKVHIKTESVSVNAQFPSQSTASAYPYPAIPGTMFNAEPVSQLLHPPVDFINYNGVAIKEEDKCVGMYGVMPSHLVNHNQPTS